jgi:hypothetical protein
MRRELKFTLYTLGGKLGAYVHLTPYRTTDRVIRVIVKK